jgi:predicted RNase H-like nuclease (RuvC/YqgF family)
MTFRQVQNQRYETAIELRVNILSEEITNLRGFVKELMVIVDHLRQKVDNVPGEDPTEKEKEKQQKEEKERIEREEKDRVKKKSKFYSILSMAGIFSLIGAGILWKKM